MQFSQVQYNESQADRLKCSERLGGKQQKQVSSSELPSPRLMLTACLLISACFGNRNPGCCRPTASPRRVRTVGGKATKPLLCWCSEARGPFKSLPSCLRSMYQLEQWISHGENIRFRCYVNTNKLDSFLLYRAEMRKHYL